MCLWGTFNVHESCSQHGYQISNVWCVFGLAYKIRAHVFSIASWTLHDYKWLFMERLCFYAYIDMFTNNMHVIRIWSTYMCLKSNYYPKFNQPHKKSAHERHTYCNHSINRFKLKNIHLLATCAFHATATPRLGELDVRILNAYLNVDYFYNLYTSSKFIRLGETIVEDKFTRQLVWWLCNWKK